MEKNRLIFCVTIFTFRRPNQLPDQMLQNILFLEDGIDHSIGHSQYLKSKIVVSKYNFYAIHSTQCALNAKNHHKGYASREYLTVLERETDRINRFYNHVQGTSLKKNLRL